MNVTRYKKSVLIIQSSIICFTTLFYLFGFTAFEWTFKLKYSLLSLYGQSGILLFGWMSHVLACSNYWLLHNNQQLVKQKEALLARDELTGIYNRRYFNSQLSRHLSLFKRYKQTFCLAIFDIDFFKKVNDSYGHDAGDQVLIQLCSLISQQLRESDIFARYGGEEFMLLFPHESSEVIQQRLNQIRESIAQHDIQLQESTISVTISIGISHIINNDDENSLIKRADKALYLAKENGRNRVEVM